MKLKHNINDTVYYYCNHTDMICLGRIVALQGDGSRIDELMLYAVRNVYADKDDDGYESVIDDESIFENDDEVYRFVRERAYNRYVNNAESEVDGDKFNRVFDKKHAVRNKEEALRYVKENFDEPVPISDYSEKE